MSVVRYFRNELVARSVVDDEIRLGERATSGAFRTIARLRELAEVVFHLESNTPIARARSHAAGVFLNETTCDRWLSLDDDLDVSKDALRILLEHKDPSSILFAAYRLRRRPSLSIRTGVPTFTPGIPFPIEAAGFGCTLVPRPALQRVVDNCPGLVVREAAGAYPCVFLERVREGQWVGEDVAFCERAREAGVELLGMIHSGVLHDGRGPLDVAADAA